MNNPFEAIESRLSNIENLLIDLKHAQAKDNVESESGQLLTIQKAAELIFLSVPTLYGLVHKGKIPVSKKGKRLYFSKQELIAWIKSGRKKTNWEVEQEAENFLAKNKKRK